MAKILSEERVLEYSNEFKVKIVELTEHLDVQTAQVATVLGLHPVMVYRWRQEYREGKLKSYPHRRVSMTLDRPSSSPPPTAPAAAARRRCGCWAPPKAMTTT